MHEELLDLPERRAAILKIIVSEYISSPNPVASQVIARGYSLGISPATTRHEMARLEEDGLITRPHTSAGGVPSDKGYRYYVRSLLSDVKLQKAEQVSIRRFFNEVEQEPEAWAKLAVTILTQRLENMAIATVPHAETCHYRHVELVALQELIVLLILVLQEGTVKKRLLTTPEPVEQDELTTCANRFNARCKGSDYRGLSGFSEGPGVLEGIVLGAVKEIMEAEDRQRDDQLFLDGWRHLVNQVMLIKSKSMLGLVEAIEERRVLMDLLGSMGHEPGIRVVIGSENKEAALQDFSVILSNYGSERRRGAIGVIGPTRMPYGKAIPTVNYISAVLSDMLSRIPA